MVDAKTASHTPNQVVQKSPKESVDKFVKKLNVLKMKSFLKTEAVRPVHHGPCPKRMLEFVAQASVELVKNY